MKHVYTLLFLSLVLSFTTQAQSWQWAKSGGSAIIPSAGNAEERARDVAVDRDGNSYVISPIGGASPNVDGHELEANDFTLTKVDYVLAAFDCEGNYRWSKVIGGWFDDRLDRVATDTLGNVYTVGRVRPPSYSGGSQPTRFDRDTLIEYNPATNVGKRTHFILQYSSEGDLNWLKMPQPEDFDINEQESQMRSCDLSVAPNGEAYWLVQIGPGTYADGSFENTEEKAEYIFHYDVNGNFLEAIPIDFDFDFNLGELGRDPFRMVRDQHTGRFYIGGKYNFLDDDDSIVIDGELITHSMYLGAFDAEGNFLWKIENTDTDDYPDLPTGELNNLCLDKEGNIYALGRALGGDTFAGGEVITEESSFTVPLVAKIDPEGNLLWFTNAEYGSGTLLTRSIALNGHEVAVTGGYSQLHWDGVNLDNETNTGQDVYFARLDKDNGDLLNLTSIDNVSGQSPNQGTSLAAEPRGNYFMGGIFGYDLKVGEDTIYNTGGDSDFFIAKFGKEDCDCELPEADFAYTVNENEDVNFTFEGTATYDELDWSFGDGETSSEDAPQHNYTNNEETHWVCATVYTDCGYDTFCQEVNSNLDIKTIKAPNLYLYPNPARETVSISTKKALDYVVYDLNGKKLQEGKLMPSQRNISIADLSVGIYMLQLTDNNGARKTVKLVKE